MPNVQNVSRSATYAARKPKRLDMAWVGYLGAMRLGTHLGGTSRLVGRVARRTCHASRHRPRQCLETGWPRAKKGPQP
ncbi:hypothetical protein AMTR_s00013p00087860 [Amborella trichopoda]|uniref:Uncharacterized protein n=1 Tax=Amborella trichopoda TaxID=13333 RepID=W1PIQ9_AMBTC|nr:hypothetical protein AMTR_s00013p00087860 [Amborella trichopoda]